jgi:hypothetical protein
MTKRIDTASFISDIQGNTRQARFGCLGLAVHVGARASSSQIAEGPEHLWARFKHLLEVV